MYLITLSNTENTALICKQDPLFTVAEVYAWT